MIIAQLAQVYAIERTYSYSERNLYWIFCLVSVFIYRYIFIVHNKYEFIVLQFFI